MKKISAAIIATAPTAPTAMPALAPVERPEAGAAAGLVLGKAGVGDGFTGEEDGAVLEGTAVVKVVVNTYAAGATVAELDWPSSSVK